MASHPKDTRFCEICFLHIVSFSSFYMQQLPISVWRPQDRNTKTRHRRFSGRRPRPSQHTWCSLLRRCWSRLGQGNLFQHGAHHLLMSSKANGLLRSRIEDGAGGGSEIQVESGSFFQGCGVAQSTKATRHLEISAALRSSVLRHIAATGAMSGPDGWDFTLTSDRIRDRRTQLVQHGPLDHGYDAFICLTCHGRLGDPCSV